MMQQGFPFQIVSGFSKTFFVGIDTLPGDEEEEVIRGVCFSHQLVREIPLLSGNYFFSLTEIFQKGLGLICHDLQCGDFENAVGVMAVHSGPKCSVFGV